MRSVWSFSCPENRARLSLRTVARTALVTAATVVALPAAADAAAPLAATGRVLGTPVELGNQGYQVEGLGDVNGDGLGDFATLAKRYPYTTLHVVFGSKTGAPPEIASLGTRGFEITSSPNFITSVAAAGDVDHDGKADLYVRAGNEAGIVYGAASSDTVALGSASARYTSVASGGGDFRALSAGDFNGDHYDDLLIQSGSTQSVVAGGPRIATINGLVAGPRVMLILGRRSCVQIVWWWPKTCTTTSDPALPLGDFNGDGKADIAVGSGILLGRASLATFDPSAPKAGETIPITGLPANGLASLSASNLRGRSVGDLTGDGLADIAYNESLTGGGNRLSVFPGRTGTATINYATTPHITYKTAARSNAWALPAGDQNGDGKGDLIVELATPGDAFRIAYGTAATGTTIDLDGLPPIADLPHIDNPFGDPGAGYGGGQATPLGDFDGDGAPDLAIGDPNFSTDDAVQRGGVLLLTHGADKLAPQLNARQWDNPSKAAAFSPKTFKPATAATTLTVALDSPATLDVSIRTAGGATVGSFTRTAPQGPSALPWDGTINGTALATGDYTAIVTPTDAAGNRGPSQTAPFTISSTTAPAAATVSIKSTVDAPYGDVSPTSYTQVVAHCPGDSAASDLTLENGGTNTLVTDPAVAGQSCTLEFANFDISPTSWNGTATINGATQPLTEPLTFTLKAGVNTVVLAIHYTPIGGASPSTVGTTDAEGWRFLGKASRVTGGFELTPATANAAGVAFWPGWINPNEATIEFDATMTGGTGGNGLTMAFAPGPPSLGGLGSLLGFAKYLSTPGYAVALVTDQAWKTDPSANFVGLTSGVRSDNSNALNWLQTADPGVALKGAPVHVKVVTKGGTITVSINGVQKLQRAIPVLNKLSTLEFTAGTAVKNQRHFVSNVKVSGPPATGNPVYSYLSLKTKNVGSAQAAATTWSGTCADVAVYPAAGPGSTGDRVLGAVAGSTCSLVVDAPTGAGWTTTAQLDGGPVLATTKAAGGGVKIPDFAVPSGYASLSVVSTYKAP
jgi:hypothetical protein